MKVVEARAVRPYSSMVAAVTPAIQTADGNVNLSAEAGMSSASSEELATGLYKAYLEDLGRIGGRHETLRAFYLTVVSALFVFLSQSGSAGALVRLNQDVQVLVGLVGVLISMSWFFHMRSLASLFKKKILTLIHLESALPLRPFTHEDSLNKKQRVRLTTVDRAVAIIFGFLFVTLIALA